MKKVKIFKSEIRDTDTLEETMKEWLEEMQLEGNFSIQHTTQSQERYKVIITIFYTIEVRRTIFGRKRG